jgi:hypothetical protein
MELDCSDHVINPEWKYELYTIEINCSDRVIYLEWKYELYTTINGFPFKVNHNMIRTIHFQLYKVHTSTQGKSHDQNNPFLNGLFWSYDLPWMEVWTEYNWKRIVLIILWFTLSGSVNCMQLEADCSDHIVIYLVAYSSHFHSR